MVSPAVPPEPDPAEPPRQRPEVVPDAAALGEPVRLVTRVGDDELGKRLVSDLEAAGVEICPVWASEPTGSIAVLVAPNGQRSMATDRGPSVGLRPDDLLDSSVLPANTMF